MSTRLTQRKPVGNQAEAWGSTPRAGCMNLYYDDELHIYLIDGEVVPGLTDIFMDLGIINIRWYTEGSRDRGTAVHKITEMYDRGSLDMNSVDPRLIGFLEGYKLFHEEVKPKVLEIELPVGHRLLRYASKIDRIYNIKNIGKAIVDLKSGAKERWHKLQLSAQHMAYSKEPLSLFDLYLKSNGTYKLEQQEHDENTWLSMVNVYNWKHNK